METLGLAVRLFAARTPPREKELKCMAEALTFQVKATNLPDLFVKNSKLKRYYEKLYIVSFLIVSGGMNGRFETQPHLMQR